MSDLVLFGSPRCVSTCGLAEMIVGRVTYYLVELNGNINHRAPRVSHPLTTINIIITSPPIFTGLAQIVGEGGQNE